MSGWYLDSTRIFAQDLADDAGQSIAQLNPYNGFTIYHVFGKKSKEFKISAIVVGNTDRDSIRDMSRDGSLHGLETWEGETISGYVRDVSFKRSKGIICQSMREDLPASSPVYNTSVVFLVDE